MSESTTLHAQAANSDTKGDKRPKTRQLTVKGIDEKTIELAREAAERRGLKVSAWIRMELREAATRALNDVQVRRFDEVAINEMLIQLDVLRSTQVQEKTALETKLNDIKQDMTDIIKFQHRMFAKAI